MTRYDYLMSVPMVSYDIIAQYLSTNLEVVSVLRQCDSDTGKMSIINFT